VTFDDERPLTADAGLLLTGTVGPEQIDIPS
jgi:hypothetical protein